MKKTFISFMFATCGLFLNAQSGSLDNSFNQTGILSGNYSTGNNSGDALAVQPDGKIIVAGATGSSSAIKVGVNRHNADGSLDTTFGTNGKISFSSGWIKSFVKEIVVQPDGKIVLAGYRWDDSTGDFVLVRLNPDGSFDNTFGTAGIAIIDGGQTEVSESFAMTNEGDFILSGYVNDHFSMAKVKSDGTIDTAFGTDGWVITEFGQLASYSKSIAITSEGRIILGGMILDVFENKFKYGIAAYHPDGTIDTSFGEDGKLNFHVGPENDNDFGVKVIALKDGKILIGGHSWYATQPLRYELVVARLNADGSFDSTYGTDGFFRTRLVENGESYLADMALQADGKLVLAGAANQGSAYDSGLARVTADGHLDASFGDKGKVFLHIAGTTYSEIYKVILQPDGKIMVSGDMAPAGSPVQYFLARFLDKTLAVQNASTAAAQLYPNPASDQLHFNFEKSGKEHDAEIYNMAGQKVMTAKVSSKSSLNISKLAVGSYIVNLMSDGKLTTLRFIKK
ncbi:T9SS type A sorting domain-containing protein [Kaistella palustris]|uniref:T9SS type A sorting domain-containing protein n=1 Tax=Kaistella palustris TaxID=493376 RepID=UPI0004174D38|nr:T9SS type A sorting domain-containing protein [Kaistella palustris]